MNTKEARAGVERVRAASGDDEAAHGYEDDLHVTVLRAIANGEVPEDQVREVARIALETEDIDFSRWYA